jgi:integrase
MKRRETPRKRTNPANGKVTWVARYTDAEGRYPSAGTFKRKSDAQDAIDAAYEAMEAPAPTGTLGAYQATWLANHPRPAKSTEETHEYRTAALLKVDVEGGRTLADFPYTELRRRHVLALVDHMLTKEGRSATGASAILRSLSTMTEDAITDEVAELNAFQGVRVAASDRRVTKARRPIRVFSFEDMHAFARAAAEARTGEDEDSEMDRWRALNAEAMVRVFTDTPCRLSEVLALHRSSLRPGWLRFEHTTYKGTILGGTKTDHGEADGGRDTPLPAATEALIRARPPRIDTALLFPTPTGRVWLKRNFYRDVWYPAQAKSKIDMRPHEARHSWISHAMASGMDEADVAAYAGHTLATARGHYTHALGKSADAARKLIGA